MIKKIYSGNNIQRSPKLILAPWENVLSIVTIAALSLSSPTTFRSNLGLPGFRISIAVKSFQYNSSD